MTNDPDLSNGDAEDWCCNRGPRDSTGLRIEITDQNRFLGVKITDWVYPAEAMTAEDACELIAGIEAALDHVDAMAFEREATKIAAAGSDRRRRHRPAPSNLPRRAVAMLNPGRADATRPR